MRSSKASLWFLTEAMALMDDFVLTDQDAIQALLTGDLQINVPNRRQLEDAQSLAGRWKQERGRASHNSR